jgi:hypothetical protein
MARHLVNKKDGTPIWLDEDQFQQLLSGQLNLDGPLTPEEQNKVDESLNLARAQIFGGGTQTTK